MKLQTSLTEINHFYHSLQALRVGDQIQLDHSTRRLLIAVFGTLSYIAELLEKGSGIGAIRKLLNIFPTVGDSDSPGAANDPAKPNSAVQAAEPKQGEADSSPPEQEGSSDPEGEGDEGNNKPKNQNHPGKSGVNDYPDADRCEHDHPSMKAGDTCPECLQGKLYPAPRETLQFVGGPLITPVVHKFNDLICNLCKAPFKVELSDELKRQGVCQGGQHTYSAISMIAVAKYFFFLPLYRMQHKGGWLGTEIARSTQQDQIEKLVDAVSPLGKCLDLVASDASLYFADDTGGLILSKPHESKCSRGAKTPTLRDGRHSSVIVAISKDEHMIVLVKTDIIHSGEFMDEILAKRTNEDKPQVMWDRISCNTVTVCPYIDLACMQHARDNFYQLRSQDPKFIRPILDSFKKIFQNDAKTKAMSAADRLAFHQENSKSHFQNLLDRAEAAIKEKKYLPNSELGKACKYFFKHRKELSGFLVYKGAPVSNNLAERTISNLVLLRKVIYHFKNERGAKFADTLWKVGLTAYYNHLNIFEYFKLLLAHQNDVEKNPEYWLPWVVAKREPQLILPKRQMFDAKKPPRHGNEQLEPT